MPNPWFRLYSEFADDPKVQMMPEVMQRRLVMLMCTHCKEQNWTDEQRAFNWHIPLADVHLTKEIFLVNSFIDEDWKLLNWSKRQRVSDSSTERTRRYRERSVTSHVTDVTVQNRTEQNRNRKENTNTRPQRVPVAECPLEWIDHQAWMEFWAMRESNRWKTTDGAVKRIITKLTDFHDRGLDCNEILSEAIVRNWRGLFEIKNGGSNGHFENKAERQQREFAELLKRAEAEDAQEALDGSASRRAN